MNCSESAKWLVWKSIISSHGETRNIKFGYQINITKTSIGYSPSGGSDVISISSWSPNVSLYLELQRSCHYQIWAVKATSWQKSIGDFSFGGSNVITFWSCDIDKSLYLQLQRGHKGYVHPRKRLDRHWLLVSNIL